MSRYYKIGDITIQIESDLPLKERTFHPKFKRFEVHEPREKTIIMRHHFSLPDLTVGNAGQEVYWRPPWAIYRSRNTWTYMCFIHRKKRGTLDALLNAWHTAAIRAKSNKKTGGFPKGTLSLPISRRLIHHIAIFNKTYTVGEIYHRGAFRFRKGGHTSLSLLPTDQIFLAQALADRGGCYFHAGGVVLDSKGLLFVGHSGAGKTTIVSMLKDRATILCDDRIIVRKTAEDFKIHGTWSNGDLPDVSTESAPLHAIFFLEQSLRTRLAPLRQKKEAVPRLMDCLIKPHLTAEWWEKIFPLVAKIADRVTCYQLFFNRSGDVIDILQELCAKKSDRADIRLANV